MEVMSRKSYLKLGLKHGIALQQTVEMVAVVLDQQRSVVGLGPKVGRGVLVLVWPAIIGNALGLRQLSVGCIRAQSRLIRRHHRPLEHRFEAG